MEYESDDYTSCKWRVRYSHQKLAQGLEDLEIRGQVETIQTTALMRSTRILRRVRETSRHAVAQTPVENYELTLV